MAKGLRERLIEVLKANKRIADSDIQKALGLYAKEAKGRLRDVFVRLGLLSEKEILSLLNVELKIPLLNLAQHKINPFIARIIPQDQARKYMAVPVSKNGDTLTLAMSDPFDILAIDDELLLKNNKLECVISDEKDIAEAIDSLYRVEQKPAKTASKGISKDKAHVDPDQSDTAYVVGENVTAPIVKMLDMILNEAVTRRASDIHIEPFEDRVRVRYRVDGSLQEAEQIPKKNQNAILTRIKIMAKLDITENRIPQDGRIKIKVGDREIDLRVSVLPVHCGNKVVMRVLDKTALQVGLENLGFLPETLKAFKEAVVRPFGMILITGPTGSGKSTTLYSILNQLNTPEKNIITIEDPIEYQVKGISQIQARPEVGLDFASGLRAILRQSPDIVMVGEIRDAETVDIAVKASLTGQLVLSTLHTNDAAGAMTRLMDMGVEPFLIASSVNLVAAQRLCRRVCPDCREKIDIPKEVFERLQINLAALVPDRDSWAFYKGKGCPKCKNTGYYGRMGVLETLLIDDKIREMVMHRASAFEIKEYAVKAGMTTLREDCLKKFAQGSTTLDEVIRVTTGDE